MSRSEAPVLHTLDEVMAMLRISRSTAYRLMREDRLQPVYPDGRPKFEPVEIQRFLSSVRGYEHRSERRG